MRTKRLIFILLTLALAACSEQGEHSEQATQQTTTPDELPLVSDEASNTFSTPAKQPLTLLLNANIYTVNPDQPRAEALAFEQGKIIAVGGNEELLAKYPNAQKDNLGGATIVPGFIDAHGHLLGLGQSLLNVDLMGTQNKEDILKRLQQHATNLSEGQWLIGRGWDQNDWPEKALPTKSDLDSAFPNRPVWLERVDGHAGWANSAAMALSEQDLNGDWAVEGGEIVRDSNGQATGILIDNAASLIESRVPVITDEQITNALEVAMQETAKVGLTAMHDAGTALKTWQQLQTLNAQQRMNIRVYAMADGANDMLDYLCDNGAQIDDSAMLTARSIKLYSDGALGSRGAALLKDYSDAPGNKGLLLATQEQLIAHANKAANCGLQVNIHAIGDRGNRVTLDVLEQASNNANNAGRHRVEHSQVIALEDFQRFKDLELIASVQPTHATSDMYWAEERVGKDRIKGAYAWQRFRALGIPLALGSDFPVERPDPLHGFYAAVARQDKAGWPQGGWYPTQKLKREEALYGFTLGAAYAAFQEQQLGSLEVGKYADFVILSNDIMQIPEAEILNTRVEATYLNGQVIHSAPQ